MNQKTEKHMFIAKSWQSAYNKAIEDIENTVGEKVLNPEDRRVYSNKEVRFLTNKREIVCTEKSIRGYKCNKVFVDTRLSIAELHYEILISVVLAPITKQEEYFDGEDYEGEIVVKNQNNQIIEESLLILWRSEGIEELYKYKHRVMTYRGENKVNIELFTDLTCGQIFPMIPDMASLPEDELIEDHVMSLDVIEDLVKGR